MKLIYCFILCAAFASCAQNSTGPEAKMLKENAARLTELISESAALSPGQADFKIDIEDEHLKRIRKRNGISIVYLINSECSSCIADYIGLLETVKRIKKTDISVYGILNKNHKSLLDHYLDKFDIDTSDGSEVIHVSTESSFPFGNDEPGNNVWLVRNGNLIKKITFSNNSFIF